MENDFYSLLEFKNNLELKFNKQYDIIKRTLGLNSENLPYVSSNFSCNISNVKIIKFKYTNRKLTFSLVYCFEKDLLNGYLDNSKKNNINHITIELDDVNLDIDTIFNKTITKFSTEATSNILFIVDNYSKLIGNISSNIINKLNSTNLIKIVCNQINYKNYNNIIIGFTVSEILSNNKIMDLGTYSLGNNDQNLAEAIVERIEYRYLKRTKDEVFIVTNNNYLKPLNDFRTELLIRDIQDSNLNHPQEVDNTGNPYSVFTENQSEIFEIYNKELNPINHVVDHLKKR